LNKAKWVYISGTGKRNIIGLLHSPKLGHFIIYCDKKIVLAERKVFKPTSFSFFIDEELCIISTRIINGRFKYQIEFDTKAETPLNKIRKEINKKNVYYSLFAFSGLFTFVAIAMVVMFTIQDNFVWNRIKNHGVISVATVDIVEIKAQHHIFYIYRDSVRYIRSSLKVAKTAKPILENGFPVETNDAFLVTYSSKVKATSKLHLDYPTPKTVERYELITKTKYLDNNPERQTAYCDCVLDIAYDIDNWKGYAKFYNQATSSSDDERFNRESYQNLIESTAFADAEVDCWQFK
jgi:hypothetical protein